MGMDKSPWKSGGSSEESRVTAQYINARMHTFMSTFMFMFMFTVK